MPSLDAAPAARLLARMGTLAVETLHDPADPRLAALLALYERAIPARERKTEAAVRAMTASPRHRVGVAVTEGAVVGFFLLYVGAKLALLEYLAIDEARRGSGLGSDLYRAARTAAAGKPLIVEVESDREASPDRALRALRIGFYGRLGCRRLGGLDYILPLPGDGPPPMLDLLVDGVPGRAIDAATMRSWLAEIYAGVYDCAPDDPRLAAMTATLPAALPLDAC